MIIFRYIKLFFAGPYVVATSLALRNSPSLFLNRHKRANIKFIEYLTGKIPRSDSTEPSTRAQAEGLAEVLLQGILQSLPPN